MEQGVVQVDGVCEGYFVCRRVGGEGVGVLWVGGCKGVWGRAGEVLAVVERGQDVLLGGDVVEVCSVEGLLCVFGGVAVWGDCRRVVDGGWGHGGRVVHAWVLVGEQMEVGQIGGCCRGHRWRWGLVQRVWGGWPGGALGSCAGQQGIGG